MDAICQRINSGRTLTQLKRKIHRLRRLVAGDVSALDDRERGESSAAETAMREQYKAPSDPTYLYDILVQDVEAGRSNGLYQSVRTLVLQTANTFPEIEFNNLSPKMATVNSLYCRDRMMRCGARHQVRLAQLDYMISGIGCSMVCLKDDYPAIIFIDVLDMVWDMSARIISDVKWAATRFTQPLNRWLDMYKDKRKYDVSALEDLQMDGDQPVSLWWYFDTEGKGHHGVYLANGEQVSDESNPIYTGPNPYKITRAGKTEPMMPFDFMYHLQLPSVKIPSSIVEMMLPSQIQMWKDERYIADVQDRGRPFFEIEEGAYDEAGLTEWKDGEAGAVLVHKKGSMPMQEHKGLEIPASILNNLDRNKQELVAQSGANPYSSGDRVEGIQYSSEVQAIQGNSGLVAGTIAKDGAEYWQRLAMKFLAVGSQYDDQPFDCAFSESVILHFDRKNPVRKFLKPDADIVVEEDNLQFMPKQQRVQMAQSLVTLFSTPELMMKYPNGLENAMEQWLRTLGIRDVQAWLKPADQSAAGSTPPGAPPMPGAPGQMPAPGAAPMGSGMPMPQLPVGPMQGSAAR